MPDNKDRAGIAAAPTLRHNVSSDPPRGDTPTGSHHDMSAQKEIFDVRSPDSAPGRNSSSGLEIPLSAGLRPPNYRPHLRSGFRSSQSRPIPSSAARRPSSLD